MSEYNPPPGRPERLAPGLTRILAPNPSPMTFRGTNSYLLGEQEMTLIDPGPDNAEHMGALLNALAGRPLKRIIVTHSHLDHSPLARPLAVRTGGQILAFGPSHAGRSAIMTQLAATADLGGGEGIDADFAPDQTVKDGDILETDAGPLRVIHTPGHLGNHICLAWGDALFTGDHVMGWASSLVSPPDGDLTDFMASCTRLLGEGANTLYPGHGPAVTDPGMTIQTLINHRKAREAQILSALTQPMTAEEITKAVYHDTPKPLLPAAQRNVLAHLIDLTTRGKFAPHGPLHPRARFEKSP